VGLTDTIDQTSPGKQPEMSPEWGVLIGIEVCHAETETGNLSGKSPESNKKQSATLL
jgi:hypothetical protein